MTLELGPDDHRQLIASIQRFFRETLDEDDGDLRARQVLDFFLRELASTPATTPRSPHWVAAACLAEGEERRDG